MDPTNGRAVRLAKRLRELREHEWPDVNITQEKLARALSAHSKVAPTTLSSWESVSNPKTPSTMRLNGYARFFATRKSLVGGPHLVDLDDLDERERARFHALEDELLGLHAAAADGEVDETRRALLSFSHGPVVIICPEAPDDSRGPLANETDVNYTRLHGFADLDALIELFGHIRALNPDMHVLYRLPHEVQQAELQNHIVLLGGIGWNRTMRRILSELKKLPIEQVVDQRHAGGEVFRIKKGEDHEEQTYFPLTEEFEGVVEHVEDLALVARLANPFNSSRTLTICNGVHSRGVVGAVLAVTDETVRPANERYLAHRFPSGAFAMLIRVPVVSGRVLAPDLQNPNTRIFEWTPESSPTGD
jgi:hypothetical protein